MLTLIKIGLAYRGIMVTKQLASEEELLAYYDKNNRPDNIEKNIKKVTYPTADNVTTNSKYCTITD